MKIADCCSGGQSVAPGAIGLQPAIGVAHAGRVVGHSVETSVKAQTVEYSGFDWHPIAGEGIVGVAWFMTVVTIVFIHVFAFGYPAAGFPGDASVNEVDARGVRRQRLKASREAEMFSRVERKFGGVGEFAVPRLMVSDGVWVECTGFKVEGQ